METDQKTIAERMLETALTGKANGHRLLKFCSDIAKNEQYPEQTRAKAKRLREGWNKLQHITRPSKKQQQAAMRLLRRMEKFRNEN